MPGEPVRRDRAGDDRPTPAPTAPTTSTAPTPVTYRPSAADRRGSGEATATVGEETADAFAHGWFSDDAAFPQVALWGLVLAAIGIGSYLLSRRVRRNWVGALVGIVPFVVALYFFFQNVNRLLPGRPLTARVRGGIVHGSGGEAPGGRRLSRKAWRPFDGVGAGPGQPAGRLDRLVARRRRGRSARAPACGRRSSAAPARRAGGPSATASSRSPRRCTAPAACSAAPS